MMRATLYSDTLIVRYWERHVPKTEGVKWTA
jgi:hypothetical protein